MEKQELESLPLRQGLLVGLTLFSMFFGAGNLIISPEVGYYAHGSIIVAMIGFLITAVGLPVLSIVSVARAGTFTKLTDRITPKFSLIYATIVYLCVGPFLALPRTATTSFEILLPLLPGQAYPQAQILVFSIIFFVLAFILAMRPNKLTQIIGRISGPTLLFLIFVLLVSMIINPPKFSLDATSQIYKQAPFTTGFIKGYLTMDVFASLTYGVTICMNISDLGVKSNRNISRQLFKSGLLCGALLLIIYIGFAFIGVAITGIEHSSHMNGASIISVACFYQFGFVGMMLSGAIFLLACLNVAISLISSVSLFFYNHYSRLSYIQWAILFTVGSAILSNVGLSAILAYSVIVLQAIYPVAIVLVIMGMFQKTSKAKQYAWKYAVVACIVISIVYAVRDGFAPHSLSFLNALPLANMSMPWIVPTMVAWIVGLLIYKLTEKVCQRNTV